VTIIPGAPGWYCFLDTYNGDGHYAPVSDNNTATECLHVTSTPASGIAMGSATPTVITALASASSSETATLFRPSLIMPFPS